MHTKCYAYKYFGFWENGEIVGKRLQIFSWCKSVFFWISQKSAADNIPLGITSHIEQLIICNFQFIKKWTFFQNLTAFLWRKKKHSKTTRPWVENINPSEASHKLKQRIVTEERSYCSTSKCIWMLSGSASNGLKFTFAYVLEDTSRYHSFLI